MRLDVFSTRADAERAVADEITALVRAHPAAVIGLASGDSPSGVYRELVRRHAMEGLDLSAVRVFSLDEYLGLPPSDPRGFGSGLRRLLLEPAGMSLDRATLLSVPNIGSPGEWVEAPAACVAFEQAIRVAGGIDVQLLGVGRNGHIAFNEPGSEANSRTRVVALAESTREDASALFGGLAHVPTHAVTMGIATIVEARAVRVLAFGAKKQVIIERTQIERASPSWPASFLHGHPDATLVVDRAAAGRG